MEHLLEELALFFSPSQRCLALTGSGGKTTAMVHLAKHYAEKNLRVLVSTTTKLLLPKDREYGCDTYFLDDRALSYHPAQGERVFYTHVEHKAVAPPLKNLETLLGRYDVLLLEADGSRNLGLKLHTQADPVVPAFVTGTLALVAMGLEGKPFREHCFGSKPYLKEFPDEWVSLATYSKLFTHKQGILKRMQGRSLVLCNQSNEKDIEQYRRLASSVSPPYPIWFGDLLTNRLIYRTPS
ncbi:MAG TPA: selenium cofactor biosynthesis protein YqeC [Sphaerochaeta sp.]|nr:selenium cofactor biosynthesis protein YqeC [Sphaerochaeta sp.]